MTEDQPLIVKEDAAIPVKYKTGGIHWNIWTLFTGLLIVWFLFIHGIPFIMNRIAPSQSLGPAIIIHFISMFILATVAVFQITFPPYGNNSRKVHRIAGYIAMIAVYCGMISGFVATWYERKDTMNLGMQIGLSFAGVFGLISFTMGYRAIYRAKQLAGKPESARMEEFHRIWMIASVIAGIGSPAIMRVANVLVDPSNSTIFLISLISGACIMAVFSRLAGRAYVKSSWY
jgi:hypothetical protein